MVTDSDLENDLSQDNTSRASASIVSGWWLIAVLAVCVVPGILLLAGVDMSSAGPQLAPDEASSRSRAPDSWGGEQTSSSSGAVLPS